MKRESRAGRKGRIMKCFVSAKLNGETPQYTVYAVAKKMNMERSPHLQKLLLELVEEGQLTVVWQQHRPNRQKRVFCLAEGWNNAPEQELIEKFGGRVISLKRNGYAEQKAFLWGVS